MRQVLVHEIILLPDDFLVVDGTVDGEPVIARGWQSAVSNHFDDDAYAEMHRRDDAIPRRMTPDEVRAYFERILLEAAGPAASDDDQLRLELGLADVPLDPRPEPAVEPDVEPE